MWGRKTYAHLVIYFDFLFIVIVLYFFEYFLHIEMLETFVDKINAELLKCIVVVALKYWLIWLDFLKLLLINSD